MDWLGSQQKARDLVVKQLSLNPTKSPTSRYLYKIVSLSVAFSVYDGIGYSFREDLLHNDVYPRLLPRHTLQLFETVQTVEVVAASLEIGLKDVSLWMLSDFVDESRILLIGHCIELPAFHEGLLELLSLGVTAVSTKNIRLG